MNPADPQEALHVMVLSTAKLAEIDGEIDSLDQRIAALFTQRGRVVQMAV